MNNFSGKLADVDIYCIFPIVITSPHKKMSKSIVNSITLFSNILKDKKNTEQWTQHSLLYAFHWVGSNFFLGLSHWTLSVGFMFWCWIWMKILISFSNQSIQYVKRITNYFEQPPLICIKKIRPTLLHKRASDSFVSHPKS